MKTPDYDRTRLLALLGDVMDGTLDEAGTAALNDLLATSAEARRIYRAQMQLHANLHLEYSRARASQFMPGIEVPDEQDIPAPPGNRHLWKLATIAAAAAIAILAVIVWPKSGAGAGFATLESERATRWAGSNLPTATGARLGHGTLTLMEGLATIRFDSGAVISLEAPATLVLIDAMYCRLNSGTAVANVPESAIGFRIDTPSARVVDFGTRFAVSVEPESGGTLTQVFEGMVTVEQPTTGDVVELRSGQRSTVNGLEMQLPTEGLLERPFPSPIAISNRGLDWRRIPANKDGFVGPRLDTDSDTLLYVKSGERAFRRITYLGFDLVDIAPDQILDADLLLQLAPTGLGLASHVPDATFEVYAVLDPDAEWPEGKLHPRDAPARQPGHISGLAQDQVRLLGSFVVGQGVQHGNCGIQGGALVDFLRERAGTEVTLVVVRATYEIEKNGLVHGFASHRHPSLPGPKLGIRLFQEP